MPYLRKLTIPLLLAIALFAAGCSRPESKASTESPTDSVEAAENAYFQFNLDHATAIYENIRADEGAPVEDRAEALRQLARFAALFDQNIERARELLREAEALGTDRNQTLLELTRIERESGNYEAARNAAVRAAETSQTLPDRHDARTEFARATLREAVAAVLDGQAGRLDRELLSQAFAQVEAVLADRGGQLTPTFVQLELALLLGEGPTALEAWKSYFHVPPGTTPTGVLAEPSVTLERILPRWSPSQAGGFDPTVREDLVLALASSRMFEAAALVAALPPGEGTPSDPRVQEILSYHDFLSRIEEVTSAFYRASTRGPSQEADEKAYEEALEREARVLWPRLQWAGERPRFTRSGFQAEIGKRFGAVASLKRANGHFGLHMGHRVIDEEYPIEQYGKQATLRFVSLDFMVSNGYSSWFWDGRAGVGGWADHPTIIQVRPAYVGAGIEAWERLTDPESHAEAEEEIAGYGPADLEIARANPTAYLPGLAHRIEFAAQKRLLDSLAGTGLESADLRLAFIAEIERINLESSIIAHEGRHAIDSLDFFDFMRRGSEKEFRAKLSEVAFSSAPFLAIGGGILSRNIGDGTSHGDANLRIMEGLVAWMEENREAIADLDPTSPLLPQLDLLTDEQLRQAFRSMDPIAS